VVISDFSIIASFQISWFCILYFFKGKCIIEIRFIFFPFTYRYSYMIDNVILLITGTLHQRSIAELVPKCHPLGSFEQMEAVSIASNPTELFNAILVDTPLGMNTKFFLTCFLKLLFL